MAELIQGMAAFEAKLKALELTLQRKVLIDAAKAGAAIVRDDAIQRAPRDTGALAEGIAIRVSGKDSDIHEATVDVGPSKDEFYSLFVEYGTAHMPAQPFLGPALEENKERVAEIMKTALLKAITKVAG